MTRTSTAVLVVLAVLVSVAAGVAAQSAALKDPAKVKEQAPATYNARFDTSVGVHKARSSPTRIAMFPPLPSTYARCHSRRPISQICSFNSCMDTPCSSTTL